MKLVQHARTSTWVAAQCLLELRCPSDEPGAEDRRTAGAVIEANHFRAIELLIRGLST